MKWILTLTIGLPVLAVAAFFILGRMSAGGTAPGLVDGRLSACPSSPNCVSSEAGTPTEKAVESLPLSAWERVPGIIETMGGRVVREDDAYIAAEFTSKTFRFVDDVEFRKADDAVHMRSASRVGYSDRGVNRERAAAIASRVSE